MEFARVEPGVDGIEGVVATYHGESGRNMYIKGKEHLDELRSGKPSNCLVIHNNVHHNGSRNPHFIMTATGRFNKTLDRQIDESVRMKFFDRSGVILNSGRELRAPSRGPPSVLQHWKQGDVQDERREKYLSRMKQENILKQKKYFESL